jgi:hypothetical protein
MDLNDSKWLEKQAEYAFSRPFTPATGVRLPVGTPVLNQGVTCLYPLTIRSGRKIRAQNNPHRIALRVILFVNAAESEDLHAGYGRFKRCLRPFPGADLISMLPFNDFTLSRMLKNPNPPSCP